MHLIFTLLLVALLSSTAGALPAAALEDPATVCKAMAERAPIPVTYPLRPLRPWIQQLIRETRVRSATLDRLIRAAESSGAVIYIDEADAAVDDWDGRTVLAATSCGFSYLRIELRRLAPNDTAAMLAHELQHVLEIVSSGATTEPDVLRLYERIGTESRRYVRRRFETAAANRVGRETRFELRQRQAWPLVGLTSTAASRSESEAASRGD